MLRFFHTLFFLYTLSFLNAQEYAISGTITLANNNPIEGATIFIEDTNWGTVSDRNGTYSLENIPNGTYTITTSFLGLLPQSQSVKINGNNIKVDFQLETEAVVLEDVVVKNKQEQTSGLTRLRAVEGSGIYAAKKNEVIVLNDLTANLATNVSRQIYAKVAGLNIWESDGAGVQLGIGGRGLSPNRNSNFNTRQNGYDISADALGYPESYYTPPVEAIERIEIVRGAASLQYGTQFGGMLNFKFKEGPTDKKIEWTSRQTAGSFGLFSSFNSVGGMVGKTNYYGFHQYKQSNGWRPNASLQQHTGHLGATFSPTPHFQIRPEYTFTTYLAQQPGGVTDAQFASNPRQSSRERNWFQVDWNLFALTFDYAISDKTKVNSRSFGLVAGRDALGNLDPINLLDFGENRDFLRDRFRNWGNETRVIHRYTAFNQPAALVVGGRFYKGNTQRQQGEGDNGQTAVFDYLHPDCLEGSDFELPSTNFAFFSEQLFNINTKWSITPGIRYEYIQTKSEGYYRNQVRDLAGNILVDEKIQESKENPRSFLFFGLGMSYKPSEQLEVYGNFSQNYRAINFNDIRVNVGSLVVDPNLKDERGFNLDLGFRGKVKNILNFDFSIYHLAYKDRIGTILKKEPNPVFNNLVDRTFRFRTNIANASILGLESLVEVEVLNLLYGNHLNQSLSLFSNVALTEATYATSQEAGIEGNEVELVPSLNLKTGITFRDKNFSISYQYGYVSEHFSDASNAIRTPTAIEGIIPSYSVMDCSMKYAFRWLQLEVGSNNIANNFYFTRRATGYPGPGIIPSDGRSFYATIQIKL